MFGEVAVSGRLGKVSHGGIVQWWTSHGQWLVLQDRLSYMEMNGHLVIMVVRKLFGVMLL